MNGSALMARPRKTKSKGETKQLRRSGYIPAIIYGRGMENTMAAVEAREVERILTEHQTAHPMVSLNLAGKDLGTCMIQEVTRDPLTRVILHIDFYRLDMKRKVITTVPIQLLGRPEGELSGGVLQYGLREVEVEGLPGNLPEKIEADISRLKVGDHLAVAELAIPEGITLKTEPTEMVCTIIATRAEREATAESAAPTAPAAPGATGEAKEHTA